MMLAVPLNWYGLSPNRKRPTDWQGALVSLLFSEYTIFSATSSNKTLYVESSADCHAAASKPM